MAREGDRLSKASALPTFVRAEFDSEIRSGFARLKRVPDTSVRHFLDYYAKLTPEDRDSFVDAMTLSGAGHLGLPGGTPSEWPSEALASAALWATERLNPTNSDAPYRYCSVPILRACVGQAKIDRGKGIPSTVPNDLEAYAASIRSVKAPELRKHVRVALNSLLGATPRNRGGGNWFYEGTLGASQVTLVVDYGGRYAQLRYSIRVVSTSPALTLRRMNFESLFGAGLGDWDFIVEENLHDSIELLSSFVAYFAELPRRLEQFLGSDAPSEA